MSDPVSESLLVFSDVHLGSDIQEIPNGAATRPRRSESIDRDLVRLLAHYRAQKPPAERWRIVIAGDFIDFIGMTVAPSHPDVLETELTDEERWHGVGNAVDHARLKLARVAQRHADVFAALGAFVGDGHALSLVHGNHDIEFHWDEVKDDFRAALFAHVDVASSTCSARDFAARIEFNPWFFYRDGIAYIEHGHQYDSFCATAHVMAPLSPLDPRRVARGFSDILLRYVVRPTRGMKEYGHEHVGVGYYLVFGLQLGVSGMARLGLNFAHAVAELFRLRRAHFSEGASALRAEHDVRVAKLAEATRLGLGRLRALLSLQAKPITSTVAGILRGVLLDRLAVAVIALSLLLLLALLAVVGWVHASASWAAGGVVLAWTLLHVHLSRQRTIDPAEHMVERAAHLAKLFPAAFVVMGHTHVPAAVQAGTATYINVGSWAEEAPDSAAPPASHDEEYRAPRTHLVIHVRDERPEARFCTWRDGGPEELIKGGLGLG